MSPEPLTVHDWCDASAADALGLYERERAHWLSELSWDTTMAWREIEQSRTAREVSGFIVRDAADAVRGWAYFLLDGDTAHLGGMVADAPQVSSMLLDACLERLRRPHGARRVLCFLPVRAQGLRTALQDRAFACEDYLYQSLSLPEGMEAGASQSGPTDGWKATDAVDAARLLREAYHGKGRHFAPQETQEEWTHYVGNLVERAGCGLLAPELTRLHRGGHGLDALVLVTRIAPDTVHLAQVAVHPARQRQGLGRTLVEEACRRAAAEGFRQATLLVGESNVGARRLYATLGFTDRASFLAAIRDL